MAQDELDAAVLMADITGSTSLYEAAGDAAALHQIDDCLGRLRCTVQQAGGTVIRSKGDDVLCFFEDPSSALRATRQVLALRSSGSLALHAGLHYGRIIRAHGDIFGDAVNLTARLAALAKPSEALISQSLVARLPEAEAGTLRFLDRMTLKGRSAPTAVYSLLEDDTAPHTLVTILRDAEDAAPDALPDRSDVSVTLRYAGQSRSCGEGGSLSIGRAGDCDLVIGQPWVSRKHVTVTVRRGKVELDDQSASGTHVATRDGDAFFLRRETALLVGSGVISLAVGPSHANAELVHYEVAGQRRASHF